MTNTYHIIIKALPHFRIFRCQSDKYAYLRNLYILSKKYEATVLAFAVMDTHIHLLIRTGTSSKAKKLSVLIGIISSRYAKIFNKKYCHKGSIFEHSFIKFPKQYEVWQIDTIFYILNNPLEANMCKRHNQYPFTSYKLHIGAKTSLSTIIKIDNSLIEKHFADADDFKKVLKEKLQYQRDVAHIKYRQSIE